MTDCGEICCLPRIGCPSTIKLLVHHNRSLPAQRPRYAFKAQSSLSDGEHPGSLAALSVLSHQSSQLTAEQLCPWKVGGPTTQRPSTLFRLSTFDVSCQLLVSSDKELPLHITLPLQNSDLAGIFDTTFIFFLTIELLE